MKVRIRRTPEQREIDGVKLDRLAPGSVKNVPWSIGSWLIAEGYADAEMRAAEDEPGFSSHHPARRRRDDHS